MYAQWRTMEDYEQMRQDPTPAPFLQEAMTLAKFEPGIYDVVETFAPPNMRTGTDAASGSKPRRWCPQKASRTGASRRALVPTWMNLDLRSANPPYFKFFKAGSK